MTESYISDVTQQAIIAALVTIVLAWFQHRTKKSVDEAVVLADKTHTLVNSNMGVQLRLVSELSRWKADRSGKPEDAEAADMADRMLKEHDLKQGVVDEKANRQSRAVGGVGHYKTDTAQEPLQ